MKKREEADLETHKLTDSEIWIHGEGACGSGVGFLRDALEGDVVAKHLTWIDEREYLLGDACLFATNGHDAACAADGDVRHVLNESCGQYPLVFIELIERAPAVACKLEDGLHAKDKLRDVVLFVLEVGVAANRTLVGLAVELNLVIDLHLAFRPLVGQVDEL